MTTLTEIILNASEPTFNLTLILATLWIINNNFAKYSVSPLTIGQYAINEKNRLYHNDLINEIIKRAMITPNIKLYVEGGLEVNELNVTANLEDNNRKDENQKILLGRDKCIWFLDSLTSYKNFERDLLDPKYQYHRSGNFLFVYTGTEKERLNNIKEIFRRLFILYCTNVNVLFVVGRSPYLYTYFPFAKNKCHSSMPEFYISFRGIEKNFSDFEVKKAIFPDKVKNMHGCELAVITWEYVPFVLVDTDPETGDILRLHGVEGLLLTLLAEKMNFKIRLNLPDPLDRGDIYPNGTATGATNMTINAEANITIISLMYNKMRSEVMQASVSYLQLRFLLAIPDGPKMSSFERLMKPFRIILWSFFSSSVIVGIIFIYYLRFLGKSKLMDFIFGQRNRIPFTNFLSVLCGVSVHGNFPIRNFARYISLILLMYTFVLRSAYSGALYNLLQDGRGRTAFKSITEIVENNYTIYAYPAMVHVLKRSIPGVNIGVVDEENSEASVFKRISNKEKVAICLVEYITRIYNQMNPNRRVEILDQTLMTSPFVFYMPPHSYLRFRADELIVRILAAGLVQRFESYYLYSSHQRMPKQREPVTLSFHILFALFCIYGILVLLSFAIFLLELASAKSDWCRIIIDFLNI